MSKGFYYSRISYNEGQIVHYNDEISQKRQIISNLESLSQSIYTSEEKASEDFEARYSNYEKMSCSRSRRIVSMSTSLNANLSSVASNVGSTFSGIKKAILSKIEKCEDDIRCYEQSIASCEGDISYCREQIRLIEEREEEEKRERERQNQCLI